MKLHTFVKHILFTQENVWNTITASSVLYALLYFNYSVNVTNISCFCDCSLYFKDVFNFDLIAYLFSLKKKLVFLS